ncbi:hypothetical protein [Rhodosalinus sediminis]|uniref:hypothetical protein n=1 Tax=Rhodosalinus sediminis TaxID=1940533 RepID=UPI002356621E|nr:hypothetical protein [Rhodosalinus sediminis]
MKGTKIASERSLQVSEIRELLKRVDEMIADQDERLAALEDRIDAADDPDRRTQLDDVADEWTAQLDRLEAQKATLEALIAEIGSPDASELTE